MIGLDNGPAGGDYVRYIDTLLAQRAAALVANDGAAPTFADAPRMSPQVPWPSRPVATAPTQATAKEQARLSASQAGAVANALMSQVRSPGIADGPSLELIGIAIGVAIVVAGVFTPTAGAIFVIAGIGLVYAMVKRLVARRRTP